MLSSTPNFFQTRRSLSEIKAELLPAYFKIWAETKAVEKLVLADLIAGNGLEANGENATALQIAETFREDENAREYGPKTLELFLSDASSTNLEKLKQHLVIPEEEGTRLPENIHFLNEPETRETLAKLLQKVPGLLVAEPFGYALAAEIAAEALENTSADLFLLFDYKKLEKNFLAEIPTVFIARLFGADLPAVKAKFRLQKSAKLREQFLTGQLEKAFRDMEFYPLTFRMNAPGKLAGKTIGTYLAAKEWLQTYSELQEDGVPLFGANLNYQPAAIPGFSEFLNRYSLESLSRELSQMKSAFHYQTIRQVYERHSPGTHFVLANYLAAFRKLQKAGTVNLVDASNKKMPEATPASVVFYKLHG